uniref:Uncharacterized protein n=1 Tax=Zea mays TaxID=4577 RepID=B6U050_MAIZE|nr:hypothetical protein [Zea mays]
MGGVAGNCSPGIVFAEKPLRLVVRLAINSITVWTRGSEESPWLLESQVLGEEQVVQEEPHIEEFDSI